MEEGHTSSISQVLLGFGEDGQVSNFLGNPGEQVAPLEAEEVLHHSTKLLTILDLAGHPKYLKTTVSGLVGHAPDFVMLAVEMKACLRGGDSVLGIMSREHLGIALALNLRVFVVVTKCDSATSDEIDLALESLHKTLRTMSGKSTVLVRSHGEIEQVVSMVSVVPILVTSSVTGLGLALLRDFLFLTPNKMASLLSPLPLVQPPSSSLVRIDESFDVDEVGLVLGGTIHHGAVSVGDSMLLGPHKDGHYEMVKIRSIQVMRVSSKRAVAGQSATFAVRQQRPRSDSAPGRLQVSPQSRKELSWDSICGTKKRKMRKGMVLLSSNTTTEPVAAYEFEAEILLLQNPHTMTVDYEPVVHIHTIAQSARIKHISSREDRQTTHGTYGSDTTVVGGGMMVQEGMGVQQQGSSASASAAASSSSSQVITPVRRRAKVGLRFLYKPEYISVGDPVLLREGCTRGVGRVTSVHYSVGSV
uniref:Elongation factor Tu, chloroplastic n=1 Tax=Octactis speculum TaxID=3111310 RepID=A0A7S2FPB4_9STRA|mmetsp:Transcript_25757/g.35436  ORF Transcript_25757/g.35436 Transcript_25757/m.35436 type:complete len:473 (+) Transcript_25757:267-1685(+)